MGFIYAEENDRPSEDWVCCKDWFFFEDCDTRVDPECKGCYYGTSITTVHHYYNCREEDRR